MSSRSGSRASTSKKDNNPPKELQFCRESGEKYRPFTDPKRIETNDAKKASAGDSRARVKGVPDRYLGVMNPAELSPSAKETPETIQDQRAIVPLSPDNVHSIASGQQEALALDAPAACDFSQYNVVSSSESLYSSMDGVDFLSSIPQLHLDIPASSICQSGYHSSLGLFLPDSSCHSACDDASMSAYQQSPVQLVLPNASHSQLGTQYNEQADDALHFPDLGNGLLVNSGFTWLESTSLYSSDSNSSFESPGSTCTSDSFESIGSSCMPMSTVTEAHREHYAYSCLDAHPTSHQFLGTYAEGSPSSDFDRHFLSGPETNTQSLSISATSADSAGLDYPGCVAETLEIAQNMNLEATDLSCLDRDHDVVVQSGNNCFTERADPNVFFAPCAEYSLMSEA